ncbi:MAG: energy-coupling factor transporter transmembrane protein EcfT [Firmicutes bacterium]|nr:energy-coupling factor transporter transmembrane protein EcfT [Bacillota bacterium]
MAIKDITLGQYYPAESPLHSLDPRTKILGTLVFMVSIFLVNSFCGFAFAALCLLILVRVSRIPLKFIVKGLKPILFVILFTLVMNLFMTPGETWLKLGFLVITKEGVYRAFFMAIRLILLISCSSLLTLTTKPVTLTDGLDSLLNPLKRFGFPSHEITMMLTIAIRFIPTLMDETDKIMKAQTARGADFESGGLKDKAKSLIPLLVPLFVSAFRIAADLAMAMEARCYRGGEGRSRMNPMRYRSADLAAFLLMAVYTGLIIRSRSLGLF